MTSHILDQGTGLPAAKIPVTLSKQEKIGGFGLGTAEEWGFLEYNHSDKDGRTSMSWDRDQTELTEGVYRLRFSTEEYFRQEGRHTFYPFVDVVFRVDNGTEHYHVTLQINPLGYTTGGLRN